MILNWYGYHQYAATYFCKIELWFSINPGPETKQFTLDK